jgi:hypothetical protein
MIPKNLKPGDTFEDGNKIYEVISVVKEGYISKRVGEKKADSFKFEEVNPLIVDDTKEPEELPFTQVEDNQLDSFNKYTKTEINRLNNEELTKVCASLGLETGTGKQMKADIIKKLGL